MNIQLMSGFLVSHLVQMALTDTPLGSHCHSLISNGVCNLECDSELLGIHSSWDHDDCEQNPVKTVSHKVAIVLRVLPSRKEIQLVLDSIRLELSARINLLNTSLEYQAPHNSGQFEERNISGLEKKQNISSTILIEIKYCDYCGVEWIQHKLSHLKSVKVALFEKDETTWSKKMKPVEKIKKMEFLLVFYVLMSIPILCAIFSYWYSRWALPHVEHARLYSQLEESNDISVVG